jgi:hypothetical protein
MITRETLAKITALADDARGSPAVRAVARRKLEAYQRSHPDLFTANKPASSTPWPQGPAEHWTDDLEDDASVEERCEFFDPGEWRISMKGNWWRVFRGVTVTLFSDHGGGFKWCVAGKVSEGQRYSRRRFASTNEAMADVWEEAFARVD